MTRDQHLKFCKKCLNRRMDMNQGLVCNLTGTIAAFQKDCPDFRLDDTVTIVIDDKEALDYKEVKSKLPAEIYQELRKQQNLTGAVAAGFMTSIATAILWSVIAISSGFIISYMSVLVAVAIGFAMRKIGKGVDQIFGFIGAGISLFGCVLGNVLTIIGLIAIEVKLSYFETLLRFDYGHLPSIMAETFQVKDLVFYTIAIVGGYTLAIRKITEKDIDALKENQHTHSVSDVLEEKK